MVIAIDGMSATGKSTLAFNLAKELGLTYLNSGSIYRCVALKIMRKEISVEDENKLIEDIINMNINFVIEDDIQKVYLDNEDVTLRIKDEEVSVFTSKYAGLPALKTAIRTIQKKFVEKDNVVIEGRDIATRIAPQADYKFYLHASLDTRANRLYNGIKDRQNVTREEVYINLKNRDEKDIEDKNFIKPVDVIEIDTTNLTIDEALEVMLSHIKRND